LGRGISQTDVISYAQLKGTVPFLNKLILGKRAWKIRIDMEIAIGFEPTGH